MELDTALPPAAPRGHLPRRGIPERRFDQDVAFDAPAGKTVGTMLICGSESPIPHSQLVHQKVGLLSAGFISQSALGVPSREDGSIPRGFSAYNKLSSNSVVSNSH